MKLVPDNLTRTQRTLWYRHNNPLLDMEYDTASYCSNYRQLEMARGTKKKATERGLEWLGQIGGLTRTERLLFYRRNEGLIDREMEVAGIASNWVQFNMAKATWAKEITRVERQEAEELDVETSRKLELWLSQAERRVSQQEETMERVEMSRTREMRDTVSKTAVDIHRMPWERHELEAAASSYVSNRMKVEALEEELSNITQSLMTTEDSVTKYGMSAREMAAKACREDEEAVAASRKVTRSTVIQKGVKSG